MKKYVDKKKRKDIRELRGKIKFRDDYDYKSMRKNSNEEICNTSSFFTVHSSLFTSTFPPF
jgi:hypothetical protein